MALRHLVSAALLFGMTATAADARDICWVDRVKRTASGVEVYFWDQRSVTRLRPGQPPRSFLVYPVNATTVRQYDDLVPVEFVPAIAGDRLFSSNSPHDSCSLAVVVREGRIGLELNASMQIPGYPPNQAAKFIPAD